MPPGRVRYRPGFVEPLQRPIRPIIPGGGGGSRPMEIDNGMNIDEEPLTPAPAPAPAPSNSSSASSGPAPSNSSSSSSAAPLTEDDLGGGRRRNRKARKSKSRKSRKSRRTHRR